MLPLANEFVKVMDTTEEHLYSYSPGICMGYNNRIIISCEASGNNEVLRNYDIKGYQYGTYSQGRVYLSDDKGSTFRLVHRFPFMHMRPFAGGSNLYIIGQCGDLMIIKSDDNGETWSAPAWLTEGQLWHQAPCNVWYEGENVYLVMERYTKEIHGWGVSTLAPVLMRGSINSDLSQKENWTFSSELPFYEAIDKNEINHHGIPFYWTPDKTYVEIAPNRYMSPPGWLEANVVKFRDRKHYFYGEKTYHLLLRAHTGITNTACLLKVVEKSDKTMETMIEKTPSGKKIIYISLPGGQMKFHVLYDEISSLFWLLSTQARDSMTRTELLSEERYNLSDNERNKLVLHFSTNCFDWCFAGLVAKGEQEIMSRHYASMAIHDNDLYIVSRSGDENSQSAHNGNFISFHKVEQFRKLIY